jgi:hypothetical protein
VRDETKWRLRVALNVPVGWASAPGAASCAKRLSAVGVYRV